MASKTSKRGILERSHGIKDEINDSKDKRGPSVHHGDHFHESAHDSTRQTDFDGHVNRSHRKKAALKEKQKHQKNPHERHIADDEQNEQHKAHVNYAFQDDSGSSTVARRGQNEDECFKQLDGKTNSKKEFHTKRHDTKHATSKQEDESSNLPYDDSAEVLRETAISVVVYDFQKECVTDSAGLTVQNSEIIQTAIEDTVDIGIVYAVKEENETESVKPTFQDQETGQDTQDKENGGNSNYMNDGQENRNLQLCEISPPSRHQVFIDNVNIVPASQLRQSPEKRFPRPHSRSISSLAGMTYGTDGRLKLESCSQAVQRSYSMRVPSARDQDKPKVRRLLRDLSFADTDAKTIRNYGSLRGGHLIPRRTPSVQTDIGEDKETEIPVQLMPELEVHLMDLMQELLSRGKVRQVAVLDQGSCSMLVSLPPWKLSHQDEIGLVKAVTCTPQAMLKMFVGHDSYTFFKHAADKIMGRCGDNVLVAQKTNSCVVVGLGNDSTPGSCLYEVSELARVLIDKGW